jgi:hypothetical protein
VNSPTIIFATYCILFLVIINFANLFYEEPVNPGKVEMLKILCYRFMGGVGRHAQAKVHGTAQGR